MRHYLFDPPGKTSWKRYLVSFLIILASLGAGGFLYLGLLFAYSYQSDTAYIDSDTFDIIGVDPTMDLLFSNLTYLLWLLGIWIGVRFVQKRRLNTLITGAPKISWKRIFGGFGLFFVLILILGVFDYLFNREQYSWNGFTKEFFVLALVVLLLTPIQTTVEELMFRGFFGQWLGKKIRNPILLSVIIGAVFGSLHFANPEMELSALWVGLDYLAVGFMLTYIAVKSGSLELSIGAHAANNMFIFWFTSSEQSAGGEIPSLFSVSVTSANAWSLIMDLLLFIVFYILAKRWFFPPEARSGKEAGFR